MTAYRIEVGKRQRVEPRQIVGALANEGGLSREDFGHIQIRPDFSLVELPADMSKDVLDKLRDTRISGKLIEISPDRKANGGGARGGDGKYPSRDRSFEGGARANREREESRSYNKRDSDSRGDAGRDSGTRDSGSRYEDRPTRKPRS
jgi:ATP-dependent RNA helicase DeaD